MNPPAPLMQDAAPAQDLQRLASMIDSVSDAIITIDSRGIIEYVNRGAQELFGYRREQLLGQNVAMLMHQPDSGRHDAYINSYLKTGQSRVMNHRRSVMGLRQDGSPVPLDLTLGQMVEDGEQKFTAVMRDVTEQRRLQQLAAEAERRLQEAKDRADEANRAKSVFLATMSHEIRTPMNGVLGSLELLGLSDLSADQRETVVMAEQSGRELLRILDDILDFSKIEAGRLELRHERTSLREHVIGKVIATYATLAARKGLRLHSRIDSAVADWVCTDPLRLRQILHNFVSNAVKFTLAGSIELSLDLLEAGPYSQQLRFSVRDTGIGISPDNQARLFKPFVQADGDTTRRFGGTGLGLAICIGLADSMGATIAMESAPGVGTTMSLAIALPITSPAACAVDGAGHAALPSPAGDTAMPAPVSKATLPTAPSTPRAAPSIEQAVRDRTLVLVADDHATNRNVLIRQLASLGYAAESAANGVEALQMLASGRHALLVSDCQMPEMDGYTLARTIREQEAAGKRQRAQTAPGSPGNPVDAGGAGARRGASDTFDVDGVGDTFDVGGAGDARHTSGAGDSGGTRGAPLPIIAFTANAFASDAVRALLAGMDDYLSKPTTIAALAALLAKYLPLPAADSGMLGSASAADAADAADATDATEPISPPAPRGGHSAPALDEHHLAAVAGDDPAARREILADFQQSCDADAAALHAAFASQNLAALLHAAHRLCGASKTIGATGLAAACTAIEHAGRAPQATTASAAVAAAYHRISPALAALNHYLQPGPGRPNNAAPQHHDDR
jgi:PAS domain S-box-containing protein